MDSGNTTWWYGCHAHKDNVDRDGIATVSTALLSPESLQRDPGSECFLTALGWPGVQSRSMSMKIAHHMLFKLCCTHHSTCCSTIHKFNSEESCCMLQFAYFSSTLQQWSFGKSSWIQIIPSGIDLTHAWKQSQQHLNNMHTWRHNLSRLLSSLEPERTKWIWWSCWPYES